MSSFQLTSLQNAVQRLAEGWTRYQLDVSDGQIRDGLIQRFEFTYELSHRLLRRFLATRAASPALIEQMSFQDLIRTANEQDLLLRDWTAWRIYREMRGITSHSYDETKALQVVAVIPRFLEESRHLLARMEARLA